MTAEWLTCTVAAVARRQGTDQQLPLHIQLLVDFAQGFDNTLHSTTQNSSLQQGSAYSHRCEQAAPPIKEHKALLLHSICMMKSVHW
jgi:hypothetical protein